MSHESAVVQQFRAVGSFFGGMFTGGGTGTGGQSVPRLTNGAFVQSNRKQSTAGNSTERLPDSDGQSDKDNDSMVAPRRYAPGPPPNRCLTPS
eukprot:7947930-Pyramimonas_sp.AAC.1